MNRQRVAGLLMILVEAVIVTVLWDTRIACALIAAAAVAGYAMPGRLSISRKRVATFSLLLGVAFILKWRLFTTSIVPRVNLIWPAGLGYCLAEYFMLLQVLALFMAAREARLRPIFVLFGGAAMVFGGDILISSASGMLRCTIAAMIFSALAAAFFTYGVERLSPGGAGPRPRRPHVVSALLLLIALAGAGVTATLLHRYRDDVDRLFLGLVTRSPVSETGFSGRARLGSIAAIKTERANRTAMRVVAESAPGYLRGRVFDAYDHGEWRGSRQKERRNPAASPPPEVAAALKPGDSVFANETRPCDTDGQGRRALNVWPESSLGSAIFATLEWQLVAAPTKTILSDDMGAIESPEIAHGADYTVHDLPSARASALDPADRERYTAVPGDLNPGIQELAARLFDGCETDEEKIAAAIAHLQNEHEYELGIQIPWNVDPLAHFLLTDPPPAGHCEYFATAAAVLLRLGGVPARYVTGFVAAEHNAYGGYWVARNRDAHAWVEAYEEGRGWTLVEATPGSGVPDPPPAGALAGRWDALKFRLRCMAQAVLDLKVKGLLALAGRVLAALLRRTLASPSGLVALTACGGLLTFLLVRRRRRREWGRVDPAVQSLWRLLARMDRRLRRHGLVRRTNETLHQFAARVERDDALPESVKGVAGWYRQYAALRYSGTADEEAIGLLEAAAAQRNARPRP